MKVSLIKSKKDRDSFRVFKGLGFDIYDLEDLDEVDNKILNLISEECNTIILTNEVAGFSEDIIKKYKNNKDINIIITRDKSR